MKIPTLSLKGLTAKKIFEQAAADDNNVPGEYQQTHLRVSCIDILCAAEAVCIIQGKLIYRCGEYFYFKLDQPPEEEGFDLEI